MAVTVNFQTEQALNTFCAALDAAQVSYEVGFLMVKVKRQFKKVALP